MFFYVFIILSLLFFNVVISCASWTNVKKRKVYLLGIWVVLFVLYAFRDISVGADTIVYEGFFKSMDSYNFKSLFDPTIDFEPGYKLINFILFHISHSFLFFNIAIGLFLSVTATLVLGRYTRKNLWASVFLFLVLCIYFNTFNILRQSLAAYICWLGIPFILQKDFRRFLVICIIAFLFHKTSLIFFPMYWADKFSLTKKNIVFALLGAFCVGKIIYPLMYFATYLLDANNYLDIPDSGGYVKLSFMFVAFCFLYLVISKRKLLMSYQTTFFLKMMFFMLLLQVVAVHFPILTRLTEYFTVSMCFLFPIVLIRKIWGKNLLVVNFFFVAFFILYFYLSTKSDLGKFIDYKSISILS